MFGVNVSPDSLVLSWINCYNCYPVTQIEINLVGIWKEWKHTHIQSTWNSIAFNHVLHQCCIISSSNPVLHVNGSTWCLKAMTVSHKGYCCWKSGGLQGSRENIRVTNMASQITVLCISWAWCSTCAADLIKPPAADKSAEAEQRKCIRLVSDN